jgi:hypothetical protein
VCMTFGQWVASRLGSQGIALAFIHKYAFRGSIFPRFGTRFARD